MLPAFEVSGDVVVLEPVDVLGLDGGVEGVVLDMGERLLERLYLVLIRRYGGLEVFDDGLEHLLRGEPGSRCG